MRQPVTHLGQLLGVIAARRRALNLSQKELADKLGISQAHLAHIENGTRTLSLPRLIDLLNILGLELIVQDRAPSSKQEW